MGFGLGSIFGGGGGLPGMPSLPGLGGSGGGSSTTSGTMNSGGTAGGGNIGGSTGNASNANNTTTTKTDAVDKRQVVNSDGLGITSDNSTINVYTVATRTANMDATQGQAANDMLHTGAAVFGYDPNSVQAGSLGGQPVAGLNKKTLLYVGLGLAAAYLLLGGKK